MYRNRRSAEQMLAELKQRLREISNLAGDVLNWDQATYMPEGAPEPEAVSARCSTGWRTIKSKTSELNIQEPIRPGLSNQDVGDVS